MTDNSLVSILIPNYNKSLFLRETLESVISQSYENWECIIVDDHSSDNSWEILKEFAKKKNRIKIIKRPSELPKGGNSCRNYAFSKAKGEFIQYFDSDDIMAPNMLVSRVNSLNRNNSDFVVSNGRRFEIDLLDRDMIITPLFAVEDFLKFFILIMTPWLSQSVMYRRSFLERTQISWDERLRGLQDVAFNFLALTKASKIEINADIIDWYWREIKDNTNTMSKIYTSENYTSLLNFLQELHTLIPPSYIRCFNRTVWETLRITSKSFGKNQFRNLITPLYKVGILNKSEFESLRAQFYYSSLKKIIGLNWQDDYSELIEQKTPKLEDSGLSILSITHQEYQKMLNNLTGMQSHKKKINHFEVNFNFGIDAN